MDEQLNTLYNEYILSGHSETPEQFLDAKSQMGDEDFFSFINTQIDLKKKDNPEIKDPAFPPPISDQIEGIPQNIRIPQTENNEIQPNQSEINSLELDSILETPSLESVSIPPNEIKTPEIKTNLPDSKLSQVIPPSIPFPIINQTGNILEKNLEFLAGKNDDSPQNQTQILVNNFSTISEKKKKEEEEFLKKYANKDYLPTNIQLVDKNVPYYSWSQTAEDVKKSNDNLLSLQKNGDVSIQLDSDGKPKVDQYGNYEYTISSDSYLDQFNTYIEDINRKSAEENIDRARYNQGNIGNNPTASEGVTYLNELQKNYNTLFTEDQIQLLGTKEGRDTLEIQLEVEKRLKENPKLNYNEVYSQVLNERKGLSDEQKSTIGKQYVQDLFFGGLQKSAENESWELFSNDNNGIYASDEKDEFNFYKSYFNNPNNISDFGEFMNDYGKNIFDSSWVMRGNTQKNQRNRKELFETFLDWKGKNDRMDSEFSERAFKDSEAKAQKFLNDGDSLNYQTEISNLDKFQKQYTEAFDRLQQRNNEFISSQNAYSKTTKEDQEKENFFLRVQNGETSANVQNFLGNVVLGVEKSVQSTVTGVARILATPLGKGNVNDTIDLMSEPLSIGNVDIARISDQVNTYQSGNKTYKEINGTMYEVGANNKIFRPLSAPNKNDLTEVSKDREYNWSGIAFVTSKMLTDIYLTQKVGTGINNNLSTLANAVSNSKKVASIFGEASQLAKLSASFARVIKNADNATVSGWYVQMYNDNYLSAKNGGIKSEEGRHVYAMTTSLMQSLIQRINPDTNFLRAINSDYKAVVSSLLQNNSQKAILALQSFGRKAFANTSKELVEENVQQVTQDLTNLMVNTIGKKDLQISNVDDYKDVFVGTVIPSIIASILGGRTTNVNIGDRNLDLTKLTRNELVTELARSQESVKILQDFKNNAFFQSQENEADKIISEIKERQKYINQIPDSQKYSTEAINNVIPILQSVDQKNKALKDDNGTFKEKIENDITALNLEVNSILDNDLNEKNTENTQPNPEQETQEGQATEIEPGPEVTSGQNQNIIQETLNPEQQNSESLYSLERMNNLPFISEESETLYNDTMNVFNDINWKDKNDIKKSVSKILDLIANKPIPENKIEHFLESKEKFINSNDYYSPDYIEKYINIILRDFSTNPIINSKQNQQKNEVQNEIISQPISTEALNQSSNSSNESIKTSQSSDTLNSESTQVKIDESIFNDQTDNISLSEEDSSKINSQLSDAIALFESFNNSDNKVETRSSNNGKYSLQKALSEDGSVKFNLIDNATGKNKSLSNKQKNVYIAEYINSQEYPETIIDHNSDMTEDEVIRELISNTQNPKELAQIIISTPQFDTQNIVGTKEWAIAQVIGSSNVNRQSFIDNDDINNITNSIARTYFAKNKGGKGIDQIAMQASEVFANDYSGESITEKDIIDFIKKFPNDPSKAERPNNPLYDEAVQKFTKLTGENPTKNLLDKLVIPRDLSNQNTVEPDYNIAENLYNQLDQNSKNDLIQEYNDWFNSLTLDEKLNELTNTYPDYEQEIRTENSKSQNESQSNRQREGNKNASDQSKDEGDQSGDAQEHTSDEKFGSITEEVFNSIIEQLKKPFKNAFKNLNVTTNLEEAIQRANELGENTSDLELKNKNGNIYGFKLTDGTIYINPDKLNSNTPIHEFSHLWEQLMPNAWKNGLSIFKDTNTGKELFDKLKSEGNYSNLTDNQLWSEALNTHIGNYGEWIHNNPKGKMREFADWVKSIFLKIGKFFGIQLSPETSLRMFSDKVIGELFGEKVLLPESVNQNNEENNKIQFSKSNNPMPRSTFAKIVNVTSNEGKTLGYEELSNSAWFKNLPKNTKSNITEDNFHNIMLEQAKLIQENNTQTKKEKNKLEKKVLKLENQNKEKIQSIVDDYKSRIKEIKSNANKNSREKSLEQRRALRQAVKDIKSYLSSNMFVGKITPSETNRLIRKASEIGTRKDIQTAVNEFIDLYNDIKQKSESRIKQKEFTRYEYDELYSLIKNQKDNNVPLDDIINSIKYSSLSNKKYGVLNEKYQNQINKIYKDLDNEKMSPNEAYEQMKDKQSQIEELMADNRTLSEKIKNNIRSFIKYVSDRQYLPKKLLQEIGANNTESRMISMAGASAKANDIFSSYENKIFTGLSEQDKKDLNAMIIAKRSIAIEKNRLERNLPPIEHPYANPKRALEGLKEKIGDEKFNDLEERSTEYFKAFKRILTDMRDNGLISDDAYQNMIEIDYQPRLFIDRLLDAHGNLDEDGNFQNFNGQNGGLKSEVLKGLKEGSNSAIIDNSEWLLKTAISSRYKAMAMNEVNKRFMTDEFWKAQDEFDKIDPENFKSKKEERFYNYFKELQSMIKDNPIIGTTEQGNPKYKYDSAPQGFKKAYYYVDGVRNEFFLANDFHSEWHDVKEGLIFNPNAKGIINKYSGSALIKAMATGYNPTFAFTNTPRDFVQTLVFSPEYSNNILLGTLQLAKGQLKALTRMYNSDFKGKEDEVFAKYIQYGGGMDFLHIQGLIDKENKMKNAVRKVLDSHIFEVATLMKLSKWSELMTRMAIFERSIKNQLKEIGVKDIENISDQLQKDDIYYKAVSSARGIMDFNQGGKLVKDLDAIMPYLNAATQGTRVAIDSFKKNPLETSIRMLQAGGLMASTAIGVSYALLAISRQMGDDEDDKDKSITEIILNTYDGLSQYQRANYINIVMPFKTDKNERYVLKIAKTQFVAPLSYLMEEGLLGVMRKSENMEEKDFMDILKETSWVANKNMTPIEIAEPQNFITSVATKNPLLKASLTYVTGYDFFKDELLTFDITKSNFPRELEGYKDENIEDFYKEIGSLTGGSPARMKAFVESIVTTPETNPFVTMAYGGADLTNVIVTGDSKSEVAKELKDNIAKVFTKRLIGQSSDFNRMRRQKEKVEEEIDKAILRDEKIKIETDIIAKKISNGSITGKDISNKFNELNLTGIERQKANERLNKKINSKASDNRIFDIMYSTSNSNRAKAILIKKYFPEVYENTVQGQAIRMELKKFRVFSKDIRQELAEIKKDE